MGKFTKCMLAVLVAAMGINVAVLNRQMLSVEESVNMLNYRAVLEEMAIRDLGRACVDLNQMVVLSADDVIQSSVLVMAPSGGGGSGFVVAPHMVMTAKHVAVLDPNRVVLMNGEERAVVDIILATDDSDVAILVIDGELPPPLALSTEPLRPGDEVVGVGAPWVKEMKGSYIRGYVINVDKEIPIGSVIMKGMVVTDMHGAPGVSGGPVVCKGKVVGLFTGGAGGYSILTPVNHDMMVEILKGR